MKAMRLHKQADIAQAPLRLEEQPLPEPGAGQLRLRVSVCGVCHTDLHTVEGDIHPPHLPITPGHQVVGVVDAIGPGVDASWMGKRVGVPWLYAACGVCQFCRQGQENLCPHARFTGFHEDGGYAEFVLAEAAYALPLPDGLSDEQAAPLLCAGIVGYRAVKLAEVQPGERVGLFGFGASAHLMIQVLRHWGCEVAVFTRSAGHQQHAWELGAAWVGDGSGTPPWELDRAVVFAPAGAVAVRALEVIRPGGTVAINAIHMSDLPSFPYATLYGERTLRSVANATRADGYEFLRLAAQLGIQPATCVYPLDAANQALDDLKHSRFNGEAVLQIGDI